MSKPPRTFPSVVSPRTEATVVTVCWVNFVRNECLSGLVAATVVKLIEEARRRGDAVRLPQFLEGDGDLLALDLYWRQVGGCGCLVRAAGVLDSSDWHVVSFVGSDGPWSAVRARLPITDEERSSVSIAFRIVVRDVNLLLGVEGVLKSRAVKEFVSHVDGGRKGSMQQEPKPRVREDKYRPLKCRYQRERRDEWFCFGTLAALGSLDLMLRFEVERQGKTKSWGCSTYLTEAMGQEVKTEVPRAAEAGLYTGEVKGRLCALVRAQLVHKPNDDRLFPGRLDNQVAELEDQDAYLEALGMAGIADLPAGSIGLPDLGQGYKTAPKRRKKHQPFADRAPTLTHPHLNLPVFTLDLLIQALLLDNPSTPIHPFWQSCISMETPYRNTFAHHQPDGSIIMDDPHNKVQHLFTVPQLRAFVHFDLLLRASTFKKASVDVPDGYVKFQSLWSQDITAPHQFCSFDLSMAVFDVAGQAFEVNKFAPKRMGPITKDRVIEVMREVTVSKYSPEQEWAIDAMLWNEAQRGRRFVEQRAKQETERAEKKAREELQRAVEREIRKQGGGKKKMKGKRAEENPARKRQKTSAEDTSAEDKGVGSSKELSTATAGARVDTMETE
ncbi:predicted protein [Postia placenta Mad-698-R]|nr:predicted protein [Postia placenta Mad-698-R]